MKLITNKNKNPIQNKINKINKFLPYILSTILFILAIFPISINSLSLSLKTQTQFNSNSKSNLKSQNLNQNLNALNLSFQKAFLSTEDFQVTNIYPKQQIINSESIFFDEKNSSIYETGKIKNINILLKKNYPTNKLEKAIPLGNGNLNLNKSKNSNRNLNFNKNNNFEVKGMAKSGNILYQFSGIHNKILRFTYPNLDFLTPIDIDSDIKSGEGLAELSEDFLIASNGTDMVFILDCKNDLNVINSFSVKNSNNQPLFGIKNMVVVGEFIYLTRENDKRIFKISPATGKILKVYNMLNLLNFELKTNSISLIINKSDKGFNFSLNGIAYDKKKKVFILTGKNWGHYYEVDLK
jgi:glutamine cyclotransferase